MKVVFLAVIFLLFSTGDAIQRDNRRPTKNPKPSPGARRSPATKSKIEQSQILKSPPVRLSAHDMRIIFQELVSIEKQQQIAADPLERKKFVSEIKQLLALARIAEESNYAEQVRLIPLLSFEVDKALNDAYRKKNPDAQVPDRSIDAYYASHPKAFDDFIQINAFAAKQAQGPGRIKLKKQFGEFKVIAERALRAGLDREDPTRLQIIVSRSQVLAGAYLTDLQKTTSERVTVAEVNEYYEDHLADFDEVRVRHILVSTQPDEEPADDAKAKKPVLSKEEARKKSQLLLDRVRKGEDFAKLAKENSDDPGSRDNGGGYDFFGRGKMVVEFEDAAFSLKPGEVSDVIETQFGFHIIKVEERRRAAPPATDQTVRQQITEKLTQEKLEALIAEIADRSPVVVPEDFDTTPKVIRLPPSSTKNPEERGGTKASSSLPSWSR